MFGRIYQLLPAVTGVLGIAIAWADAAYLPAAGPVPLRFRPPPPVAVQSNEPADALLSTSISQLTSAMFGPSNTNGVSAGNDAMPVVPVIGPPIEYNARDPVTDPARATGPDPIISPQMLIKYFPAMTNGGTNAARMGVVTPFGFTPPTVVTPTPAAAPSGKAANPTSP